MEGGEEGKHTSKPHLMVVSISLWLELQGRLGSVVSVPLGHYPTGTPTEVGQETIAEMKSWGAFSPEKRLKKM